MKKSILSLSLLACVGVSNSVLADSTADAPPVMHDEMMPDSLIDPNSLYGIIVENQQVEIDQSEKSRLENERDILSLQAEILIAQRQLDKLTGVYQEPQPALDVQKLREELILEMQAQMMVKNEESNGGDSGSIISDEDTVDGITTVKIEEIINIPSKGLVAEVTTVGQAVRLVEDQIIYGWRVKQISFDSITFEKDQQIKKLYVPI